PRRDALGADGGGHSRPALRRADRDRREAAAAQLHPFHGGPALSERRLADHDGTVLPAERRPLPACGRPRLPLRRAFAGRPAVPGAAGGGGWLRTAGFFRLAFPERARDRVGGWPG